MTAKQIFIARTNVDADVAARYVRIAESRVRSYLHYGEDGDVSGFSDAVAQIAMYLYQEDQARARIDELGGMSSESFSEGGVSVRNEYGKTTELVAGYEALINHKKDYSVFGMHTVLDDYNNEQLVMDTDAKEVIHVMITPVEDAAAIEAYGADAEKMVQCVLYGDADISEHDRIQYNDEWYEITSIMRWNTHRVVRFRKVVG